MIIICLLYKTFSSIELKYRRSTSCKHILQQNGPRQVDEKNIEKLESRRNVA